MAGRPELAGDGRDKAMGLGFPIRNHWEREEGEGNCFPASERPGRARAARTMADGGELLRRACPGRYMTSFCSAKGWGESGREGEAHLRDEKLRKWLKRRDGARRFTASSASSYAVRTESGREGKWGGGKCSDARGSPLENRGAGWGEVGIVGAGLPLEQFQQGERGGSGRAVGEGEADRRARPVSGEREGKGGTS